MSQQIDQWLEWLNSEAERIRAKLAEFGPIENISDKGAKADAQLALHLLRDVELATDIDRKVGFMRAASERVYSMQVVLEIVPALEEKRQVKRRRSEGGKTTARDRTLERDARIDDIRRIAAELRTVHGDIKDEAIAAFIVERRGLKEGVVATRKLLTAKKSTEK